MNEENLEDEADRGNIVVTDVKYSRIRISNPTKGPPI